LGAASGPGWDGVGEQSVTEYVMCPTEHAGKVIGHGGEKINAIQTESGATVKIQNQSDVGPGQPRRVTITGPPDRVAAALRMVNAIIDKTNRPASAPRQDANKAEILVPVQAADFGKIIGRGGETIRRLQEESGVRMQVDRPNSQVVISGDPSGCEVARTLLQEVIDTSSEPASAVTTTEISAQGQEGRIIGKGGENIKSMAEQTGAKIVIVKETGMVRISGSQDNVQAAIDTVNAFIETQLNPVQRPGGGGGGGGGDSEYVPQHIGASEPGLIAYKPLWETHQSPEGYTYYYNTTTGETQWDEPPDFDGI
jgi:far upstream element-binding protein